MKHPHSLPRLFTEKAVGVKVRCIFETYFYLYYLKQRAVLSRLARRRLHFSSFIHL